MRVFLRPFVAAAAAAVLFAHDLPAANPILNDGDFTGVTRTSTGTGDGTLYGQFGSASGVQLTLAGWSTSGYNFVFLPGTIDGGNGNGPTGSNTTAEQTGQYSNTYMYGANNNAGSPVIGTPFAGYTGNYVLGDGAFDTGAITQTVGGLTIGNTYEVNFYWAAAQQYGYTGGTTENWTVALGTAAQISAGTAPQFTTPTVGIAQAGFSGWMKGTTSTGGKFDFQATAATEVLSFLATGTPQGQPPFSALAAVSVNQVPEPGAWLLTMIGAALLVFLCVLRRRRARTQERADLQRQPRHALFVGSTGSGKATFVRDIGRLVAAEGLSPQAPSRSLSGRVEAE